jgi:hypothetical protein
METKMIPTLNFSAQIRRLCTLLDRYFGLAIRYFGSKLGVTTELSNQKRDERYVVEIGSWNETVTTGRVPVTIKEHDQGT